MKYRVLKVWPFWIYGIKYHDQYLAEFMESDDISTIFACPDYTEKSYIDFTEKKRNDTVNSYEMLFLRYINIMGKPFPYQIFKFAKQVKIINPDVIHVFGISNFTSIFTLISAKLISYKGKIVFNDHSDPNERKKGFIANIYYLIFRIFYYLLIKNRYTIIVPDLSASEEMVRRYGKSIKKLIKIFPLGYDDRVFCFRNTFSASRTVGLPLILGFAGKIFPAKRLELLIDVVKKYTSDAIELHIAGLNIDSPSEYQETLLEYIVKSGCKNIYTYKFISNPERLAQFYSKIDVAVYPGSISITTFEANGCGCPIILYESLKGLENRVSDLRGMLFKTQLQLSECIDYYLNKKQISCIDHKAIAQESKTYSWSNIKKMYYNEYGFDII